MIQQINAQQLLGQLPFWRRNLVVEVSEGETFTRAHLPGAMQYSLGYLTTEFPNRFPNRKQPILLYGVTAEDPLRAARFLNVLGYEHILVYPGGKDEWIERNYPVESDTYRAAA